MELEEKFKRQLNKNQSLENIIELLKVENNDFKKNGPVIERELTQKKYELEEMNILFKKFKKTTEKEVSKFYARFNADRNEGIKFFDNYIEKTLGDTLEAENIVSEYCQIVSSSGNVIA